MANCCMNSLEITGPEIDIFRFVHITKCDDLEPYVLSQHMPIPAEHVNDSYEWCCMNWGNKWGDMATRMVRDKKMVTFFYETPWTPFSDMFIQKISADFPTLKFVMQYEERGMGFLGVVVAERGEIIFSDSLEPVVAEYNSDVDGFDEDQFFRNLDHAFIDAIESLLEKAEGIYEANSAVS